MANVNTIVYNARHPFLVSFNVLNGTTVGYEEKYFLEIWLKVQFDCTLSKKIVFITF